MQGWQDRSDNRLRFLLTLLALPSLKTTAFPCKVEFGPQLLSGCSREFSLSRRNGRCRRH